MEPPYNFLLTQFMAQAVLAVEEPAQVFRDAAQDYRQKQVAADLMN